MHPRNTFEPLYPRTLSKEEFNEIVESHLFIKENIDKTVKVRVVCYGNEQLGTIDK